INSSTLFAVAIDSRNDVIITASTIFSIIFTMQTGMVIDGFIGLAVALMLLRTGFNIAKSTVMGLIGKSADKAVADKIKEIILRYDGIIDVHDLVIHNYGARQNLATIHAEVPAHNSIIITHGIIETAERDVFSELGINLVIRPDPVDIEDKRLQNLKNLTLKYIAENYPETNAHDFRLIGKDTDRAKFVFELEIPHEYDQMRKETLIENIKAHIGCFDTACDIIIDLEYGFVAKE
ncbi:MAG: cation-efflux pump, partial [Defluviitaleaceae bacterium]|nr:cation-efflux pump [Defluviitaleaceae bacterium]